MASNVELAGAQETRPRSLGLRIQEHRGIEGVKETSARPRMGPVDAVGAVAAMAGGKKLHGAADRALEAVKQENNSTGRKRGARGSHRGEKRRRRRLGDGGTRGGVDGEPRRSSGVAVVASSCTGGHEIGTGRAVGGAGKARFAFYRGRARGDAPMTT